MKNKTQEFYPVALTIAGSDSGGGAGIQVDVRTFNAYGVYGCTAISAITAQNPDGVRRIDPIPAAGVQAQIEAVCDRYAVRYVKTGMLFNCEIVEAVAAAVKKYKLQVIVDPVMVATSGAVLLEEPAIEALRSKLLPVAQWMTPNLPEAELLLGRPLQSEADYAAAALECAKRWGCRCFLKSGHAEEQRDHAVDYIALPDGAIFTLTSPRLPDHGASHGTGCTLSAALAANLAVDSPWKRAVCEAKSFVLGSLAETVMLGDRLEAMYPPEEDYQGYVKLEEYRK